MKWRHFTFLFRLEIAIIKITSKKVKIVLTRECLRRNTMSYQNMSDIIEAYLKQVLSEREQVDIRRSEIASRFDCVPSQINYVINTRFTVQKGYLVESKRGGGGYIRIMKVKLLDESDVLDQMIDVIGDTINEKDSVAIVQTLFQEKILSNREAKLMLVAMEKTLYTGKLSVDNAIRANILKSMLSVLRYQKQSQ